MDNIIRRRRRNDENVDDDYEENNAESIHYDEVHGQNDKESYDSEDNIAENLPKIARYSCGKCLLIFK